jgi:hypothetical protein
VQSLKSTFPSRTGQNGRKLTTTSEWEYLLTAISAFGSTDSHNTSQVLCIYQIASPAPRVAACTYRCTRPPKVAASNQQPAAAACSQSSGDNTMHPMHRAKTAVLSITGHICSCSPARQQTCCLP